MTQKQQTESKTRKRRKPIIGMTMMMVRFLMGPDLVAVEVGVIAEVVVGSSVELKILDGAMANAVPNCVWKWQL